jgi:hypothetical protein
MLEKKRTSSKNKYEQLRESERRIFFLIGKPNDQRDNFRCAKAVPTNQELLFGLGRRVQVGATCKLRRLSISRADIEDVRIILAISVK